MIYVDRYGVLKMIGEPSEFFSEIPEETIEIVDDWKHI